MAPKTPKKPLRNFPSAKACFFLGGPRCSKLPILSQDTGNQNPIRNTYVVHVYLKYVNMLFFVELCVSKCLFPLTQQLPL